MYGQDASPIHVNYPPTRHVLPMNFDMKQSKAQPRGFRNRKEVRYSNDTIDLLKSACSSVLEPWPFRRHKDRPNISAIGSHRGSDMFNIAICHPLSPAQIRDGMDNGLSLLKTAWDEKVRKFGRVRLEFATSVKFFPMPLSGLGRWHPDSHPTMGSIAVNNASRALSSFDYAWNTMFPWHAALLIASNAACLISGFDFQIWRQRQKRTPLYTELSVSV